MFAESVPQKEAGPVIGPITGEVPATPVKIPQEQTLFDIQAEIFTYVELVG